MKTPAELQAAQARYALARHIPEMSRGFTIHTNYGPLDIEPEEAPAIVQAVKLVLAKRLRAALSSMKGGAA